MLRPLALVTVGEEQRDPAREVPLRLRGRDELVDDHLRAVREVAELGFPQDERFGERDAVPVFEAEHGKFREVRIEHLEASLVLGATGWQTFRLVTLPNVKWGLIYGVIVLNARAMGEFGAVSVVSGHIRGMTNTVPLHVEILYNEYQTAAAFAVASLLTLLALITLVIKTVADRKRSEALAQM